MEISFEKIFGDPFWSLWVVLQLLQKVKFLAEKLEWGAGPNFSLRANADSLVGYGVSFCGGQKTTREAQPEFVATQKFM